MTTNSTYPSTEEKLTHSINQLLINTSDQEFSNDRKKQIAIAYNDRGLARYKEVEFVKATQDYDESLKYYSLASAYYNRGVIRYRMGDFNEALEDMLSALKVDENFTEASLALEKCKLAKEKELM